MLPFSQRIAFLLFACVCIGLSSRGFLRIFRLISSGSSDTDVRNNQPLQRVWYALKTTLLQDRTFRNRPVVSFLHSWIFYGFVFYLLVNVVDAVDGFYPIPLHALGRFGALYSLAADVFSALVIAGVVALLYRRFISRSRTDFRFNEKTLLHEDIQRRYVTRDSLFVSLFILFHVGSRALGMGAKLRLDGPDQFQPFATLLSHAIAPEHAHALRIFGYWGALGSVLAFLFYFPYSKHIHIFMAPLKYAVARTVPSGVLPEVVRDIDVETETLGAGKLQDLAWPRLLDAYACIQCNRCQDVCPATATGKSLSPSALEINKRMELNNSLQEESFTSRPLLQFALTPEAAWACTTCGACMQVCPVQDEPMLDIIDIRRQQVMMEGKFPALLQSAFRGMERARNPWGIAQESRLAWANGLDVPTIDENPSADVLYWVGCAASYDPQAQKTARALVRLLQHAEVNFAVLGKKECCTGDSARRAGNEFLYRELAEQNIQTLNECAPKLIIATCPHCMNSLAKEYPQLGGNYKVMHHTEFLDGLVKAGKLSVPAAPSRAVAFHDPCYLGRHNDVYEAPRNLLNILTNDLREFGRNREQSFCCGAGGAQFWKEEEPGSEKISVNRMREAERVLHSATAEKVIAVGCPFCKSMLQSAPQQEGDASIAVIDIAELLWESLQNGNDDKTPGTLARKTPVDESSDIRAGAPPALAPPVIADKISLRDDLPRLKEEFPAATLTSVPVASARAKWIPKRPLTTQQESAEVSPGPPTAIEPEHLAVFGSEMPREHDGTTRTDPSALPSSEQTPQAAPPARPKWTPKRNVASGHDNSGDAVAAIRDGLDNSSVPQADIPVVESHSVQPAPQRKKWPGKKL